LADIPVAAPVGPVFFPIPPLALFSAAEISLRTADSYRAPAGTATGASIPVFRSSEPGMTNRLKRTR